MAASGSRESRTEPDAPIIIDDLTKRFGDTLALDGLHLRIDRVAVLFTGLGLLFVAFAPRLTAALTLGAVAVGYLIQLVGALVEAPPWVLDLSPFHHVPAVPAVAFEPVSTAALVGIGVAFALAAAQRFARRDAAGA